MITWRLLIAVSSQGHKDNARALKQQCIHSSCKPVNAAPRERIQHELKSTHSTVPSLSTHPFDQITCFGSACSAAGSTGIEGASLAPLAPRLGSHPAEAQAIHTCQDPARACTWRGRLY
jgi:hypothetical protein